MTRHIINCGLVYGIAIGLIVLVASCIAGCSSAVNIRGSEEPRHGEADQVFPQEEPAALVEGPMFRPEPVEPAVEPEPETSPWVEFQIPTGWALGYTSDIHIVLLNRTDTANISVQEDGTVNWNVTYKRQEEDRELMCVVAQGSHPSDDMPAFPKIRQVGTFPLVLSVNWPVSYSTWQAFTRTLENREGGICF